MQENNMKSGNIVIKILVPIVIIIIGALGMKMMISARKAPVKKPIANRGALVELLSVRQESRQVVVPSTGIVQPAQEVTITPQVTGKVVAMADNFVAGGFFKKGALLFQIEKVDYELAVQRAKAEFARNEYTLASVESKARVARTEWAKMQDKGAAPPSALVLYEPQLKEAHAMLSSAAAAVKQAEINLARTRVTAPFNCLIRSEDVDLGLYVRSGTVVARLAGTDSFEIVVPVPLDELQWLTIPDKAGVLGSEATLGISLGNKVYHWQGRITRSMGEVDPQGRMARLVVAVADPYGLKSSEAEKPPLAIGMFVELLFKGRVLENIVAIPRSALHENDTVWLMDSANKLVITPVAVTRLEREEALLGSGLGNGDKIVLTNLSGAANGMKLRAAGIGVEQ